MPKVGKLFDLFPSIESISAEKVANWLNPPQRVALVENKLGNRLLYPQTLPVTQEDLDFDLAILREGIALDSRRFYSGNSHKLTIPQELWAMFPDLEKLVLAFVDTISPLDLTTVILQTHIGPKSLGTLIKPRQVQLGGGVNLLVKGKKFEVSSGQVLKIPANTSKVDLKFEGKGIELLGRNLLVTEVAGGPLGILVDLRN